MKRSCLLIALTAGLVFPASSQAGLLTFSGSGFETPPPADLVDGVNVTYSAGFAVGGGANNPSSAGGVDGTRGAFLNNAPIGEINFDTNVVVSSLYLEPQGGPASQDPPILPTLDGKLGGVTQWSITFTERSFDYIQFTSATSGDMSLEVDQLVYSQPAPSNTNKIDDITFSVIPEPASLLLAGMAIVGVAVRRE